MTRFLIVTPTRNAAPYIAQCIESVRVQPHTSWRMFVIDDASDDGTLDAANNAAGNDGRVTVIHSDQRRYALRHILDTVARHAAPDDVVVCLDGDDTLSDVRALSAISTEYDRTEADAMWTQYRTDGGEAGVSRQMPTSDPLTCGWTMSHLRTFRASLLAGIRPEYWIDPKHGETWRCAYDQALYRPVLHLAKNPHFFPRVCCIYRKPASGGDHDDQRATARRIQAALRVEFDGRRKQRVALIMCGPCADSDKRFHYGERRPPLGVLTLAQMLRLRGHVVTVIDRYAKPLAWDADAIERADVIGVSMTTPNAADGHAVLSSLQKYRPGKRILAGGPHVVLHPDLFEPYCNRVSRGEADYEIIDMVERDTARHEWHRLDTLDAVPLPAYDLVLSPGHRYTMGWDFSDTTPVIPLSTSRSCPYQCAFCDVAAIWGRKWVARCASRVVQDMAYLVREYGAHGIYFREDNFACDKRRVSDICAGIKDEGLVVDWACEIRADRGKDGTLAETMADAGCVGWYIGAESGSDRMLGIYRKGITREDIEATCANARAVGIRPILSIIDGHPDETPEDVAQTEAMLAETKPHRVYRCTYRAPEKC